MTTHVVAQSECGSCLEVIEIIGAAVLRWRSAVVRGGCLQVIDFIGAEVARRDAVVCPPYPLRTARLSESARMRNDRAA